MLAPIVLGAIVYPERHPHPNTLNINIHIHIAPTSCHAKQCNNEIVGAKLLCDTRFGKIVGPFASSTTSAFGVHPTLPRKNTYIHSPADRIVRLSAQRCRCKMYAVRVEPFLLFPGIRCNHILAHNNQRPKLTNKEIFCPA